MTREERKAGSGRPRVRVDSMLAGMKEEGVSCDMQAKTIESRP
jgi:hypothetical protein